MKQYIGTLNQKAVGYITVQAKNKTEAKEVIDSLSLSLK